MSQRVPKPTTRAGRKLAAYEAKATTIRLTRITELEAAIKDIEDSIRAAKKADDYRATAQLAGALIRGRTELHRLEGDYPAPKRPVSAKKTGLAYQIAREAGTLQEEDE